MQTRKVFNDSGFLFRGQVPALSPVDRFVKAATEYAGPVFYSADPEMFFIVLYEICNFRHEDKAKANIFANQNIFKNSWLKVWPIKKRSLYLYQQNSKNMKYNSYQIRKEQRELSKTMKANETQNINNTIERLKSFIALIEEGFKEEAGRMHDSIIANWNKALATVIELDADYDKLFFKVTGHNGKMPQYVSASHPDRPAYYKAREVYEQAKKDFAASKVRVILSAKLYLSAEGAANFFERNAELAVADAKYKLIQSIAKKLGNYQTIEVITKSFVRNGVMGFQGEFKLNTDKGMIWFETKAVPAGGYNIQDFHYRYLAHIK